MKQTTQKKSVTEIEAESENIVNNTDTDLGVEHSEGTLKSDVQTESGNEKEVDQGAGESAQKQNQNQSIDVQSDEAVTPNRMVTVDESIDQENVHETAIERNTLQDGVSHNILASEAAVSNEHVEEWLQHFDENSGS